MAFFTPFHNFLAQNTESYPAINVDSLKNLVCYTIFLQSIFLKHRMKFKLKICARRLKEVRK